MSTEIPIRNAWHMLLYAWDLAAWKGSWDAEAEAAPELLGLLARVLIDSVRPLLRRELGRAFLTRSQTVPGVKGRIEFAESLKRLTFEAGKAHCTFAVLDVDTPRNRILRATMRRLVNDPRVLCSTAERRDRLRHDLRTTVAMMEGVSHVPVTAASFRQLQRSRADRAYALPLALCLLMHRLSMLTETAGHTASALLTRDDVAFPRLFERFVRSFWKLHLPDYKVMQEPLQWHDELANPLVPGMQTDIVLTEKASGRRLVVDTKFYEKNLAATQYGGPKLLSSNLYQMYAYLRTQEHRGDAFRDAEGMLLYPTVAGELDETIRVQGHRIRFATVDLGRPWAEIEGRLLALVGGEPARTR